jgi:flagellar biosynthesis chaperone FliJ
MKTQRHPKPSRPGRPKKERSKQDREEALRLCETVSERIQAAGAELAASWKALSDEIASGTSSTELLRKRAWCNVLELRLKEQAQILEQARLAVDALWDDIMLNVRARELFNRFLKKNDAEAFAGTENLPLLARTATILADAHQRPAEVKE